MIKIDNEDVAYVKSVSRLERLSGKRILLLGSNGFLGRWIYDVISTMNDVELICMDNDIAPSRKIDNYIKHDITEPLPDMDRFDYVINCAGIASPERYMKYPLETLDVSYIGTKNILEFCKKNNVESVITFSSSEVYGTPTKEMIPTPESYRGNIATMGNRSCYDVGKQVLETLSYTYFTKWNVPVKIIRPFNLYGPHMGTKDARVLSNWMNNYIDGTSLKVYGHGKQTRTFCYAADGVAMTFGILLDGTNGEVYNIGNPNPEVTMYDLAKIFSEVMEGDLEIKQIDYPSDYPSDEPQRRCPDISKVVKDTGISPITGFDVGLKKMYDYFLQDREDAI